MRKGPVSHSILCSWVQIQIWFRQCMKLNPNQEWASLQWQWDVGGLWEFCPFAWYAYIQLGKSPFEFVARGIWSHISFPVWNLVTNENIQVKTIRYSFFGHSVKNGGYSPMCVRVARDHVLLAPLMDTLDKCKIITLAVPGLIKHLVEHTGTDTYTAHSIYIKCIVWTSFCCLERTHPS